MPHDVAVHGTKAYRYLPAIDPYSSGVAAEPGYEILGLRFHEPPPVASGFQRLDTELEARGLPASALVGVELRSPEPFSFDGFDAFNDVYRHLLAERGLLQDGVNPLARTNVVPLYAPPPEPVLLTAFVIREAAERSGTDFVIAGSGEVEGGLDPASIVARGDLSPGGLARKVASVLSEMRARLAALDHSPDEPTTTNVYTAHEISGLTESLVRAMPGVGRWGYTSWATRPPLIDVEFEMDCRSISRWESL
ncbi:hypothetical protein [Georgenia sp. AZ-5]|uniref:2-amino-5-chloromuconate deaminase CnbZ n=1 Tax=Georgenia sp. AZ-5 TaxID=3367526 RepID=UPI00375472FD